MPAVDQFDAGTKPGGMPVGVDSAGDLDPDWESIIGYGDPERSDRSPGRLLEAAPHVEQAPLEADEDIIHHHPVPARILMPDMNPFGCNSTELSFAYAYAITGNGAASIEYAGLKGKSSSASKLLERERVRQQVALYRQKATELSKPDSPLPETATEEDAKQIYWAIAGADITDAFVADDAGGYRLKRFKDMPADVRIAIKQIKLGKNGEPIVEFYDRFQALQGLTKLEEGWRRRHPNLLGGRSIPDGTPTETEPDEPLHTKPAAPQRTTTIEELVRANGDRLRRRIVSEPVENG